MNTVVSFEYSPDFDYSLLTKVEARMYDDEKQIGEAIGYLFYSIGISSDFLFKLFDATEPNTFSIYEKFNKDNRLKLLKERNALVIERLQIRPSFRGHKYGIRLLRTLINRSFKKNSMFGEMSFSVFFEPRPIGFCRNEERAIKKLRLYYEKNLPIYPAYYGSEVETMLIGEKI